MSALKRFRGGSRRRYLLVGATVVALVVFGAAFVAGSGAVLAPSNFEGNDGNMTVDTQGDTDWASLAANPQLQTLVDVPSGSNDNAFGQGTKEDDTNVTVVTGSIPPNKNDLTRAYVYNDQFNGNSFVYLAWERASAIGDAHIDFELNQNATPNFDGSTTGPVTLNRTVGDLLISYDFGGSGTPVITLFTWNGSAWGNQQNLSAQGFAEAAVNAGSISDVLNNNATVAAGEFGEASVNLTDALVAAGFNPDTCQAFGSLMVKARSSGSSTSAELKDFIAPVPFHASNCPTPEIATQTSVSSMSIGDTQTVGDTATLTGGNSPTGNVSFQLYSDANCQNAVAGVSGSAALDQGGVATFAGAQFTPDHAGTYFWGVSYPGDNHNTAASACGGDNEEIVVNPASPQVSTVADPSSAVIGSSSLTSVSDTATFTHGFQLDGQDATFTLYSDAACSSATSVTGTATISGGSATFTGDASGLGVGTYYWGVSYAGDANNNPVSECGGDEGVQNEVLSIEKASPSVFTLADPNSVVVGSGDSSSVSDTATFTDGFDLSGDSVDFTLYSDAACTQSTGVDGSALIDGSNQATFMGDASGLPVGTYYWGVVFAGDASNNPVSECGGDEGVANEVLSIIKASPSVTTVADPSSADIGSAADSVSDTATFTNGFMLSGDSVTFTLYSDPSCDPADATSVTGSALIDGSNQATFTGDASNLPSGTYYWGVVFAGDANNDPVSECGGDEGVQNEVLRIGLASPNVTTVADPSSVVVESAASKSVSDTATFTDGFMLSGDSVTFTLYSDPSCDPADATSVTGSALIDGSNQATFNGDGSGLSAGTYYWGVDFAADANNNPVSECGGDEGVQNEVLTIEKASPSIATLLSSSAVNHGGTVHDSATLSGATSDAGGTVTYSVYSDSSCTAKVADGGTVNVSDGTVPNSNAITFNTPGTYYWQASYSGDTNNNAAVSPCTSEKLVVAPLVDLAVTKVGSPNPVSEGANITWTMVVKNNGPDADTGVTISDPLPAANTFVSVSTTQGSCTGGAIISCNIGTMAAGATVTITLVTTPTQAGTVTNTVTVVGNVAETNTANNTASASVVVNAVTPPKPVVFCVAVSKVAPKQLFVGRNTTVTIHLTKQGKAVGGVRVLIKGPKFSLRSKPSNSKGVIKQQVKMKKAGIVTFTPIASKRCNTKRVGVTGVFTPPVTG